MRSDIAAAPFAFVVAISAAACAQTAPVAPPVIGQAGMPAAGRFYIQHNCASCHGIEAGDTVSPLPEAPPFQEIANAPGMTGLALHVWLRSPHEDMPHIIVEPDQVEDVWAYIRSLKTE
jgi:mono/diheme cytochrome c family protein